MRILALVLALSAHATLVRADVVVIPIWIDVRRIDSIPAETTASDAEARRVMVALRDAIEEQRDEIEACCNFSFHDRDRRTAHVRVVYDGRATPTEVRVLSSTFARGHERCLLSAIRHVAIAPVPDGRVTLDVRLVRE